MVMVVVVVVTMMRGKGVFDCFACLIYCIFGGIFGMLFFSPDNTV